MRIFIAGASGYLGSYLAKSMLKQHQVIALVRKNSSRKRLEGLPIEIINIDQETDLNSAFKKYSPEIVINTVALYGRKGEILSDLVEANIAFPSRLLCLATHYNVQAFIHTGTSLPDEISIYARTKNTFVTLANIELNKKDRDKKTIKFVNVALEHFYGPEDDSSKFTSYVIDACIKGNRLALTEGTQKRDFIYIEDVVSAYMILIEKINELDAFETISVGSGSAPSVQEFVKLIHSCSQSDAILDFGAVPMRVDELMYSCADTSRLQQLGWISHYSLEQGIHATLKRERS